MIDLHCHLIFDTDDGAKTIENTIEILREAYDAGFKEICCTPHYLESQYVKTKKENQEKINMITNKLKENNIDIKLYLGNEIYIAENINDLIKKEKVSTIADTNYVLVELPLMFKLNSAEDIICNLIDEGYNVILAHPERYAYVQKDIKYLDFFLDNGVCLQGNYESLIGKYGKTAEKILKKLLKAKKINLLSTDVHKEKSTYIKMEKILKVLKKYAKDDYYEALILNNPKKILNNKIL